LLLLNACLPARSIKELLGNPDRFDGKEVRIAGGVTESVGAFGYGVYGISDGTGRLTVLSRTGGGTPRAGGKVRVEGTFQSGFIMGTSTISVLVAKRWGSP
jgi:hypothetical protein